MRRKQLVFALTLALCLSLFPTVRAAEAVTPTPPAWIRAEEYVIFPEGKVYEPTYWNYVLQLRADASAGNKRPISGSDLWGAYTGLSRITHPPYLDEAAVFELSLIQMMYHKNGGYSRGSHDYFQSVQDVETVVAEEDLSKLDLWKIRAIYQTGYYGRTAEELIIPELPNRISSIARNVDRVMVANGLTSLEQFFACGSLPEQSPEEYQWLTDALAQERATIYVYLDGEEIVPAGGYQQLRESLPAQAQNGRTLVPIRAVSEALGAQVTWVQESNQVRLLRGTDEIVMTLGQTGATRNGQPFQMDVAPFAQEGTTFVPVRYISEFFGQTVTWDGPLHRVLITEDKSPAEGSNLEAWALPMGSMIALNNGGMEEITIFGSMHRARTYSQPTGEGLQTSRESASSVARYQLYNGWGIPDRDTLIETIQSMTDHGHNSSFQAAADVAAGLSESQMADLVAQSTGANVYMWPYTKDLGAKWGDKGILAWDLFRMSNLAQWGYTAGFLTYTEALELMQPAAQRLCETFSSWDEAYENYLDGYHWWARRDVMGQDIWQTVRGKSYMRMKEDPAVSLLFDDTLFQTGVIGLPD